MSKEIISDEIYIKELEGMLVFLAACYEATKETYFNSHLKTCSMANPNRRDLTDSESNELRRFPLIQGNKLQSIVEKISKSNKPKPENINEFIKRFNP